MATNISINATLGPDGGSPLASSPLILGGNRNHVDNHDSSYGWRLNHDASGRAVPGYRAGVIQAMRELQTTWGSTEYGKGTLIYRLGHGVTDGRWLPVGSDGRPKYLGYNYQAHFGSTGPYPYDDIKYGLDEAVEMGATPLMVANYGTGTPAEAGDLAAYCNKTTNSERETYNFDRYSNYPNNGRYDVKYWEIGNEIPWKIEFGHPKSEIDYVAGPLLSNGVRDQSRAAREFARQIRANSDIPVKIAFASWQNTSMTGDDQWSDPATAVKNMINNATTSDGVMQIDAFSYHHYPKWPLNNEDTASPEIKIGHSTYHQSILNDVKKAIKSVTAKNIEIWNTEYFTHYYKKLSNNPYIDQSFFGAVYGIDGQLHAAKNGIVTAVSFSAWHSKSDTDQFFYLGNPDPRYRTPWFRWMSEVWAKHWGDVVVQTTVSDAPVKRIYGVSQTVDMEALQVVSSKSEDGSKLYVMILNRTQDTPVPLSLTINGFNYNGNPIHYFKMKAIGSWTTPPNPDNPPFILDRFTDGSLTNLTSEPASVMLLIIPSDAAAPSPSPSIGSFTPASGPAGTEVTITGSNFSSIRESNIVEFNGIQAQVRSATTTEIVATVPSGATDGFITVTLGTQTATTDPDTFDVTATPTPNITSFEPTSGYPGQSVKIRGSNFSVTPSDNAVEFNGTQADVTAASMTELTAIIPDGATDGPISVTVEGQTGSSSTTFDVTAAPAPPPAPAISSFSPTSGTPGTAIVITGSNFNPDPEGNFVMFNGVVATVEAASAELLTVVVPSGASTGRITVTVMDQIATSPTDFNVTQPAASDNVFAVRQTVAAARLGTDGRPNFLEAGAGLTVKMLGAEAPVVMVFAYGNAQGGPLDYIGSVIDDSSLHFDNLPANDTSYLYVDRDPSSGVLTTGASTIKPIYSPKEPSNPAVGMHWFQIGTGLMHVCTSATSGGTQRQDVSDTTGVISGGDATGGAKENAFDGDTGTNWASSQTGTNVFSNAYIGDYFGGISHTIKEILFHQSSNWEERISSAILQVSDDGVTWTDIENFALSAGSQILTPASPQAGKYARLKANASTNTGKSWKVSEIEFRADVTLPGDTAWNQAQRLFVGEAVTDASTVTSVKAYALKGRDQTGRFAVTGGSTQTINHNLGTEVAIPRIGLAATAGAVLDLDPATNPNLDHNTLTFGVPSSGYAEADVVVERAF